MTFRRRDVYKDKVKHNSKLMKHNSKLKVKLYGNLLYLITVIGYISWLPYGPSSILKLLDWQIERKLIW